jgi:colanic acid/amylovoran biosynthesis glycosyltransferase
MPEPSKRRSAGTAKPARPTVAHIASHYYRLTENWIHTQVRHLTRYRPLVLTWRTENLQDDWTPELYALLERPRWESLANRALRRVLGYYPSFCRAIRRSRGRAIHAHFGRYGYLALPLAQATKLPLITTFYGFDLSWLPKQNPIWRQRYRELFEQGACFLVEGHHMARQLQDLGCPQSKITVQHLGIELDRFPFQPRHLAEGEPLCILVAARFTEKKGIVYAIEGVARVVQMGVDARLTIIGDAGRSEESQVVKQQILTTIEGAGLASRVDLRGMQPHNELKEAYYTHHIFLQPSVQASDGNNEGGAPLTLIEASATGMPIVATYHCDIPEVVQDGTTGLLAPERDSSALVHHLLSFATNAHQIQRMGEAGRQHIVAEYDAQRQGRRLDAIYDEVIQ